LRILLLAEDAADYAGRFAHAGFAVAVTHVRACADVRDWTAYDLVLLDARRREWLAELQKRAPELPVAAVHEGDEDHDIHLRWLRDGALECLFAKDQHRWTALAYRALHQRRRLEARRQQELPHIDSRELIRSVTRACPYGIVALDRDRQVLLWTGAAASITGWTAEEVLGQAMAGVTAREMDFLIDGLEHTAFQEAELGWWRKDGTPYAARVRSARLRDTAQQWQGTVLIVADVTNRYELYAESITSGMEAKTARRFQELLEAAPDAVIESDPSGTIVLANSGCERLFGYSRGELLGQKIEILVPEPFREGHVERRRGYNQRPAIRPMGSGIQLRARRKDGTDFPVEITLSPILLGPDLVHTVSVIRDVTERRRFEEALQEAKQRAESASRAKSEFLASMSHELRSPLHTVIGFSELLAEELEGPLNEKQRRFVNHILKDSQHLLTLINDILDLSKIEAGRLEFSLDALDLRDSLREAFATIQPQAAAKQIELASALAGETLVRADALRLKQVLLNLLTNAVKFTPERGRIRVDARRMGDRVAVAVADSGIGIAPEHREAIFDVFYQTGATTKGVREGTGLGLSICRRIVEQHGGRIWVDAEPGGGSRFQFTLPAVTQDESQTPRERPLVLVLEDDAAATELLREYLETEGYEIVPVTTVKDVLVKALELRPDVVLADLLLPGASGWDALRGLKSLRETRDIPVAIVSVVADETALQLGASAYLPKPVSREALRTTLRRLMKRP